MRKHIETIQEDRLCRIVTMKNPKAFSWPQGDLDKAIHLCPFFSPWLDSLSQIINNAESKGLFKGSQVGSDNVNISHLQFADDTLILLAGEEKNVMILN